MKLRKFELGDSQTVAALLGDRAVSKWTANIPYPYYRSHAEEWIKRTANSMQRNPFAVELNNKIVACVSYWPCDRDTLEVGYWVGKKYWGNGIATASLKLLINTKMPLVSKVVAKTMIGNIASQKVLINCGFEFTNKCTFIKQGQKFDANFYTKVVRVQGA